MANDNRTLVYRAQIEALAFAASTAIRIRDADAFTSASRQLLALAEDIDAPSALRDVAGEVHDELASDMTDAGLKVMSDSVADLSGASGALQSAIDAAKHGQGALFFPRLADAAAHALTSFNGLKAAVASVQQDLRTASSIQLGDVPRKLTDLLADLDSLRKAVKSA